MESHDYSALQESTNVSQTYESVVLTNVINHAESQFHEAAESLVTHFVKHGEQTNTIGSL